MSEYIPPLKDMRFVLEELAPLSELAALPGCEDTNLELAAAILEEAGKLAAGVLSPLNATGDREGARWSDGEVLTARGWREAYRQFVDGGWNGLSCAPEHGGQGLPRLVSALFAVFSPTVFRPVLSRFAAVHCFSISATSAANASASSPSVAAVVSNCLNAGAAR